MEAVRPKANKKKKEKVNRKSESKPLVESDAHGEASKELGAVSASHDKVIEPIIEKNEESEICDTLIGDTLQAETCCSSTDTDNINVTNSELETSPDNVAEGEEFYSLQDERLVLFEQEDTNRECEDHVVITEEVLEELQSVTVETPQLWVSCEASEELSENVQNSKTDILLPQMEEEEVKEVESKEKTVTSREILSESLSCESLPLIVNPISSCLKAAVECLDIRANASGVSKVAVASCPEAPVVSALEVLPQPLYPLQALHDAQSSQQVAEQCLEQMLQKPKTKVLVRDSSEIIRPFTEEQILMLYRNEELEMNEAFIDYFVQRERETQNSEFHELLQSYLRCRQKLVISRKDQVELKNDSTQLGQDLWALQNQVVSGMSPCADGVNVSSSHPYKQAVMNPGILASLTQLLQQLREQAQETLALHAYAAEVAKLQIQAYIYNLLANSSLGEVPCNAPVAVLQPHELSQRQSDENQRLRECIGDLFSFQRKPITNIQFIEDTRQWLTHLVSLLLRRSSLGDHLFLLNHVLRCPAGIGGWATHFIQPLPPLTWHPDPGCMRNIGSQLLDHSITVLATMLIPIKARESFLQSIGVALQTVNPASYGKKEGENLWVLVDSDGEEDEDLGSMWLQWQENDIVSLLNQIPMADLFRHALMIQQREEHENYVPDHMNEQQMLRFFAFGSRLLQILGQGFLTFNSLRFKQLTKRISRLIRHTVQYLSDHWEAFRSSTEENSALMLRLQVEFDQFFLRAIHCIFGSQMMGAWQFMAVLPYSNVSLPMMWRLLWTLHHINHRDGEESATHELNYQEKLKDPMVRLQFEEKLSQLPESEAFYLLTAFANMAKCREARDQAFICTVCIEVMEMAFLNVRLRERLSKEGRDLLSSISTKHTFVISVLLKFVSEKIDKIGMMSLFLFRDLPLSLWLPSKDDLEILSKFLLDNPLTSPANQLAKMIITGMNWADNSDGSELFLNESLHYEVAMLVIQAYQKYAVQESSGVIMRSLQQALLLAQTLRQSAAQSSTPQGFMTWAWDVLLSLRLHLLDRPRPPWTAVLAGDATGTRVPQFEDPYLGVLAAGVRKGQPAALYVALLMTDIGHSIKNIRDKGLKIWSDLVAKEMYPAATHALSFILPFFYSDPSFLLHDQRFLTDVQYVVLADLTYTAVAKSMVVSEFPGKALLHFAAMIKFQVQRGRAYAAEVGGQCVRLWCQALFHLLSASSQKSLLAKWKGTDHVYYLLEQLFKVALGDPYLLDTLLETLSRLVKLPTPSSSGGTGVVSSLFSLVPWASGSESWPSLISIQTLPSFPFLFWGVLNVETQHPQMTQLWETILASMAANSSLTLEAALKHGCGYLHLPVPQLQSLPLYRWAQQALEVDLCHPCLPLLWQNFFILYLYRKSTDEGSLGFRFFAESNNLSFLKKMKRRLNETSECYSKMARESSTELENLRQRTHNDSNDNNYDEQETTELILKAEATHNQHIKLTRLFRALSLWIEEPRLHESALNLQNLPTQYESERLKTLMQSDKKSWLDLVDVSKLKIDLDTLNRIWIEQRKALPATPPLFSLIEVRSASERILKRLKTYEDPLQAPRVPPLQPLVPQVISEMLNCEQLLLDSVKGACRKFCEQASQFGTNVSKHLALDCEFLDLLPNLYRNVESQKLVRGTCHSSEGCQGPATFYLKYREARLVNGVKTDVDQNRASHETLLRNLDLPPSQEICCAVVFVENCITALVRNCRSDSVSRSTQSRLQKIGVSIFHHLMGLVDGTTSQYPPTRQFISSCLDALGQEFVHGQEDQCLPLMQVVLARPSLAGLVAPLFTPTQVAPASYLQLYRVLVSKLCPALSSTLFVLLSKFDVGGWLRSARPSLVERESLLDSIFTALITIGKDPLDDMLVVLDIFRNHLQQLYQYQFPELFAPTLQLLLKHSAVSGLSCCIWEDLVCSLAGGSHRPSGRANNTVAQWLLLYAANQPQLNMGQVQGVLSQLSRFLLELRQNSPQFMRKGIYECLARYFDPLAHLQTMLAHAYVTLAAEKGSCHLWNVVHDAFAPWLDPLSEEALPFGAKDVENAGWMVDLFVLSLQHLHNTCSLSSDIGGISMLNQTWQWYIIFTRNNMKKHIRSTLHERLKRLPWNDFHPTVQDLEAMKTILRSEESDCHSFVGWVFLNVPWPPTLTRLQSMHKEAVLAANLSIVASALIQLAWHPDILKWGLLVPAISSLESLPLWSLLDHQELEKLLLSATALSEAAKFIQKSFPEALIFKFLRGLAGLGHPGLVFDVEKRRVYLKGIVHILAKATPLFVQNHEAEFKESVSMLLEHCNGSPTSGLVIPFEAACTLVSELVWLLTPHSCPAQARELALGAILAHFQDNSHLVLPLVAVICKTPLASPAHLVAITEKALLVSCNANLEDSYGGWGQVVPLLTLDRSHWEEFFGACVGASAHLSQNAFLLHILPHCKGLPREMDFLLRTADWCANFKASDEAEPKLLLLWDKVLELCLRQLDLGGDLKATERVLNGFCAALQAMGEDKLSTGLLGAVGFGKRSPYSTRLRLMCRGVSAFVLFQLPTNGSIRLSPNDPGHTRSQDSSGRGKPSQQALQALGKVESLRTNKQYANLVQHADYVWNFILDARYSLRDTRNLVRELSAMFYPNNSYLRILSVET